MYKCSILFPDHNQSTVYDTQQTFLTDAQSQVQVTTNVPQQSSLQTNVPQQSSLQTNIAAHSQLQTQLLMNTYNVPQQLGTLPCSMNVVAGMYICQILRKMY